MRRPRHQCFIAHTDRQDGGFVSVGQSNASVYFGLIAVVCVLSNPNAQHDFEVKVLIADHLQHLLSDGIRAVKQTNQTDARLRQQA